jgi:hypothetical protein
VVSESETVILGKRIVGGFLCPPGRPSRLKWVPGFRPAQLYCLNWAWDFLRCGQDEKRNQMPTLNWHKREEAGRAATRAPYRLLEPVAELSYGEADSENLLIQSC